MDLRTVSPLVLLSTLVACTTEPSPAAGQDGAQVATGACDAPQEAWLSQPGVGASARVVRDFDGDGKLDVALDRQQGFSVLRGRGDGTFEPEVTYDLGGGGYVQALAVGDLDGDGVLDLVVTSYDDRDVVSFAVWTGDGTGGFDRAEHGAAGSRPLAVVKGVHRAAVVADLDGDGRDDVALDVGEENLSTSFAADDPRRGSVVFYRNEAGRHGERLVFAEPAVQAAGGTVAALLAADLDGDRREELVVVNRSSPFRVLRALVPTADTQVPTNAVGGFLADVNGDGLLDVVTSVDTGFLVATARRDGTFGRGGVTYEVGSPHAALSGRALADVDGDDALDLVAVAPELDALVLLRGTGTGTFRAAERIEPKDIHFALVATFAGDFDGNGRDDVVALSASTLHVLPDVTRCSR